MEGVKDTFRHWWLVIRCSALGTFMAIIPGMGAATTQWLAYAHAVQSLEDKSRAGKGAVEGVLGPGAANNSTLGGSLITTIAFGVPASVIMTKASNLERLSIDEHEDHAELCPDRNRLRE